MKIINSSIMPNFELFAFILLIFNSTCYIYIKVYKFIGNYSAAGILHIRYRKYNLYKGVPLMKN